MVNILSKRSHCRLSYSWYLMGIFYTFRNEKKKKHGYLKTKRKKKKEHRITTGGRSVGRTTNTHLNCVTFYNEEQKLLHHVKTRKDSLTNSGQWNKNKDFKQQKLKYQARREKRAKQHGHTQTQFLQNKKKKNRYFCVKCLNS